MSLLLYRCQSAKCSTDPHGRCIFDFWADAPVCPKCGSDGRTPRFADLVIKLEILHFDPPGDVPHRGLGFRACEPAVSIGTGHGTGHVESVTCPNCKQSEAFQKAWLAWKGKVFTKADFELIVEPNADPAFSTIRRGSCC